MTYVVSKGGAQVGALQTLPSSVRSTDTLLPDTKTPLFVLVNENTASAAEVLSAALKVEDNYLLNTRYASPHDCFAC